MCNHSHEQGSSGGELALFVRLYVLEAVCAYHKGDIFGTAKCLDKVQFVICNMLPPSSFIVLVLFRLLDVCAL